jgi:hypothetical protein
MGLREVLTHMLTCQTALKHWIFGLRKSCSKWLKTSVFERSTRRELVRKFNKDVGLLPFDTCSTFLLPVIPDTFILSSFNLTVFLYIWGLEANETLFTGRHKLKPNVLVEWLTLLLQIREVPRSNLCPDMSYPDWRFSWVSSVPPGKCRDSKLGHDRFLPHPFQFIIHLSPFHSTLCNLSYWKIILK